MPEATNKRVRINLSETAKGLVQWDIIAEFETVEETKRLSQKQLTLQEKSLRKKV